MIRESVRKLTGYTPGEQPSNAALVKLNTNENPYPPSPRVAEIIGSLDAGQLRLYPDPASTRLRDRIADMHGCDRRSTFVGNGSDEILALCTRAFVENDGSIGYFVPSYSLYPVLADIRGVAKRPVELGDSFEWQLPGEYDCSLFVLASPNAPTGMIYGKAAVRDFCSRFPGVVVIDEAYVDFAREDCMELACRHDNVLVMRTLSKSYSLAGLRVGYAVGQAALIGALEKIKDSYNLDRLSQEIALAALSDVAHMRSNVARILATRDRLARALEGCGFTVCTSDANFLWVRPPNGDGAGLFEHLRRHGILVRHFPGARTETYIRITIGTDDEIDRLIEAVRGTSS